jgi:hypothetical protein
VVMGIHLRAPSTGKISRFRDQEPYRWWRRPHTRNSPIEGVAAWSEGAVMEAVAIMVDWWWTSVFVMEIFSFTRGEKEEGGLSKFKRLVCC